MDTRTFALPYAGRQGNKVWLSLILDYVADDWIFFKKVAFSIDGNNTTKTFNYFDIVHETSYGDVCEYIDIEVGASELSILKKIANSNQTIIRFEGDNYYDDLYVSDKDKEAIAQMVAIYEAFN